MGKYVRITTEQLRKTMDAKHQKLVKQVEDAVSGHSVRSGNACPYSQPQNTDSCRKNLQNPVVTTIDRVSSIWYRAESKGITHIARERSVKPFAGWTQAGVGLSANNIFIGGL